jgi:PAS domain S-box-containing protein
MPSRQSSISDKLAKPRQESAETDALFASIGEGIIATDGNGKITKVNQAALDILGYSREELIGNWFPNAIVATYDDGTAIDIMERPVTRAIVSGRTVTARTSYRRKDGSLVPVSLTVSPILHAGKPAGAIEVFRDITLDIRSDKMKTEFISVASHQLRTPLSAINVYTRMLDDGMAGELNDEQSSFIKSILASVDRMNHLINTLLNITRIEAGGVNVKIASVKLHDLAEEIIRENEPAAIKKGLHLQRQISQLTPSINTDALLVKEVFANLLSNAIKYTPGGGTVTISVKAKGSNVVFSVRDTGYGIPLAAQEHIFTKFFRADNILGEDVSGTGLGLYLTKTIAESLNGEVWFVSKENEGTSFFFSVPKQGSIARSGKFKLDAS